MSQKHPDFSILAARIAVSNLHKNTSDSFFETCQILHDYVDQQGRPAALLAEDMWQFVQANAQELDDAIDYKRDFGPALRSDPYRSYKAVMTRKTMNNYSSSKKREAHSPGTLFCWGSQCNLVWVGVFASLDFCCSFLSLLSPLVLLSPPLLVEVVAAVVAHFPKWSSLFTTLVLHFFYFCLPVCRVLVSILS